MNVQTKRSLLISILALALNPFASVFAISIAPPTAPPLVNPGPVSPAHRLMNFRYEPRGIFRPPPALFSMTEIAGGIAIGYIAWAVSVWQEHPAPLGVCPYTGASAADQTLWQNARAFCTPQQLPFFTRDGRRIFKGLATTDPAKREEEFLDYVSQFQIPRGGKTSPVPDQNRIRLSSSPPPPPTILGIAPASTDESELSTIPFLQWLRGSNLPKSFASLSSMLQAQVGLSGVQQIKITRLAPRDGAVSYRIAIPELRGEPSLLATLNFTEAAEGPLSFQSITDLKTRLGTGGVVLFRYVAGAAQLPRSVTSIVESFGNSDRVRLVSNPWVVVNAPEDRLIALAQIDNQLFASMVSDTPGPFVTITAENGNTVATVPVGSPIGELLRTSPKVGTLIEHVAGKLFRTSGTFSWRLPTAAPAVDESPADAHSAEAALSPKLQRRLAVLREQLHNKLPFGAPWLVRVEPLASPKSSGVHIAIRGGRNQSKIDFDLYETPGPAGSVAYELLNPKFNITNTHQGGLNPERRAIPLTLEIFRFPVRIVSTVKLVRGLSTILRIRRNEVLLSFESPAPYLNPALKFDESMQRSLADPLVGQKQRVAWRIRLDGTEMSVLEETLPVFRTAGRNLVSSSESSSGAYLQLWPDGTTWRVEARLSQNESRYLLSDRPLALQSLAGLFWSQWDPSAQPLRTLQVSTNPIGPVTRTSLPASFDSTKVFLHRFIEAAANDSIMSTH